MFEIQRAAYRWSISTASSVHPASLKATSLTACAGTTLAEASSWSLTSRLDKTYSFSIQFPKRLAGSHHTRIGWSLESSAEAPLSVSFARRGLLRSHTSQSSVAVETLEYWIITGSLVDRKAGRSGAGPNDLYSMPEICPRLHQRGNRAAELRVRFPSAPPPQKR
jgi:hypothetical protein